MANKTLSGIISGAILVGGMMIMLSQNYENKRVVNQPNEYQAVVPKSIAEDYKSALNFTEVKLS